MRSLISAGLALATGFAAVVLAGQAPATTATPRASAIEDRQPGEGLRMSPDEGFARVSQWGAAIGAAPEKEAMSWSGKREQLCWR
jgi:hypothetical protein